MSNPYSNLKELAKEKGKDDVVSSIDDLLSLMDRAKGCKDCPPVQCPYCKSTMLNIVPATSPLAVQCVECGRRYLLRDFAKK